MRHLAVFVLIVALAFQGSAKPDAGSGCGSAKDHCDAPKSGMGCCVSNSKCYKNDDCASFLKTCPFNNDTKKGGSLASCLPDKSEFKKAACSADAKNAAATTEGKDIPLKAKLTCFASEKLTCEVYRNESGHAFINAKCKVEPKKASAARVSTWQCCLMIILLATGMLYLLGPGF